MWFTSDFLKINLKLAPSVWFCWRPIRKPSPSLDGFFYQIWFGQILGFGFGWTFGRSSAIIFGLRTLIWAWVNAGWVDGCWQTFGRSKVPQQQRLCKLPRQWAVQPRRSRYDKGTTIHVGYLLSLLHRVTETRCITYDLAVISFVVLFRVDSSVYSRLLANLRFN